MNLGIMFSIGGSLTEYKTNGQLERLIFYLNSYTKAFEKIYIFSYRNEKFPLPKNCILIPNKYNIHRYIYTFLMPFTEFKFIKNCSVLRITQITGATPGVISKILFKKPFIATYGFNYTEFAKTEGQTLIAKLINLFMPLWLLFADKIIVTNKKIEKSLEKIKDKIIYIPNGVDTNLFKYHPRNKPLDKNIIFVGRLAKQKNLGCLLKAASNKINLLFIGSGPDKNTLIKLSKKLKVNLKILPFKPLSKIPGYFKKADIFVLPSIIEGHPKVILEAMSTGLPVIGAESEGIKEIINNKNGLLFKSNDQNDLAEKIHKLLSDKVLYETISKEGAEFVNRQYSLSILLNQEIKLLKSLCKK